jgi:hypothetical protein
VSSDFSQWKYVFDDPAALSEIKRRLEAAGRGEASDLPTYARLVDGVWFHLPNVNDGEPFEMDCWSVESTDVWGFGAALDRNGHRWFSSEVIKQPRRRTSRWPTT